MTSNRNSVIHDILRGSDIFTSDLYSELYKRWKGGNISAETVVWITILYNLL